MKQKTVDFMWLAAYYGALLVTIIVIVCLYNNVNKQPKEAIVSNLSDLNKDVEIANDVVLKNERLLKEALEFALSDKMVSLDTGAKVEVYTVIGRAYADMERFKLILSEALEKQAQEE